MNSWCYCSGLPLLLYQMTPGSIVTMLQCESKVVGTEIPVCSKLTRIDVCLVQYYGTLDFSIQIVSDAFKGKVTPLTN